MIARYRSLRSYSDVGVVRPVHAAKPLSCWFETDYVAPDNFRFQFIRPHPYRPLAQHLTKYVAGTASGEAYFCTEQRGEKRRVERESSLEMAVAGATGISQGTAHTIGALLIERVGGFSLSMLNHLRFRESQNFDGVSCYRVSGVHPRRHSVTLWVGVHDLLLRRLVHHRLRREEVRFRIRTDVDIPKARFDIPAA